MLTIGSRGSKLALWQAHWIKARLESLGQECHLEIIQTTGDKITDVALSKVGTKGLFTKEIEEALLDGRIDLAVHSLKDMPTELPLGLTLAAIPEREDPRDAVVGKKLWELPQGAKVGTSSLRRAAQMRVIRPDMQIENIRGNVDTRLRKLDEGQYDAILLAAAGLRRLGWESRIAEILEAADMCPAVGQGALAVETRADEGQAQRMSRQLDHASTRMAVTAERAVLARLGGGCQVPIGAYASFTGGRLQMRAVVVSPDGTMVIKKSAEGAPAEAEEMGKRLGDALLAEGGREILESVYGSVPDSEMSKVYLVGAGPGDPDLITIKGRHLLMRADCVLYDHLANEHLLTLAPPGCELIYVGKKRSDHSHSQEEIAALMIARARRGLTVVRLKGGDPFIFGRGGEEAEMLVDAGIPFEVVPGVTSPLGIAAYCGVPLTHRDHTSVVSFVTGHDPAAIDWDRVGQSETLVILMGLTTIGTIASEIVARGRSANTPAMAVRWGTRPDQRTLTGTLANIASLVEAAKLKPPATIIIGEVVALGEKLNWFERLPLFGKSVVVTRALEQAGEFSASLRALGANVIELPVIALVAPDDHGPLDRAIERLSSYDWLIFTSVNGVKFFLDRLDRSPHDLRSLKARICVIGPATKQAVEALHLKVDLMPDEYVAEGVLVAFAPFDLSGQRILLPRAQEARDLIPVELEKRGARIDVVPAYRNIVPEISAERLAQAAAADWITFTSSSTVKNFLGMAGADGLRSASIASIGPVTSATLRQHGLTVQAEAKTYTIDGLLEAILNDH